MEESAPKPENHHKCDLINENDGVPDLSSCP